MIELRQELERLQNAVEHFESLPDLIQEHDYIHLDNELKKLYLQNSDNDSDDDDSDDDDSDEEPIQSS